MQTMAPRSHDVPRGRSPTYRRWGLASLFVALVVCAYVSTTAPPELADAAGGLGLMLGYGSSGIIALRKTRHMQGRERFSWRLVGLGLVSAATGVTLVAVVEATGGTVPAFGPLDLFFVAAYALIITGFASLPHLTASWAARTRVYLDSLVGALSLGAVMWVVILDDLLAEFAGAGAWDRWAGTAYPLLDVAALMVVIIVSVRRSSYRFDIRLLLFAVGIIAQSAADLTFLMSGVGKTFEQAEPIYPLFVTATVLYLTAALLLDRHPKPRAYADRRGPLVAMLAPYTAAALLVTLLIIQTEGMIVTFNAQLVFVVSLLVISLVIARQVVAIRENRLLVERQRAELVSSISHELRTPLTAIVGFLDVLDDESSGVSQSERRELTSLIHDQARHMSGIVSDLILLARGSPDEMTLKESRVDVADLVTTAVTSVEKRDMSLSVEVDGRLEAMIDSGRVRQLIVNLLTNAVRYGEGRSLILVRREGSDLAIEVHDNGPGVPKKYELAIWDRFERGVNRLNAATPGSGIGLAVVNAITQAHGGDTAYRQSERLGGACFRVVLPDRILVG